MDLTQRQLEEMVEGKKPRASAVFYEKAALDVAKSKAEGRRVYQKKVYIKVSQMGVTDSISYEAQPDDIRRYREEYEYFLQNKQGATEPGIEIIPNLDIAHLQELRDYGILTIPKLASTEVVPPHLEYAKQAAVTLNKALQESTNGNKEESEQKESGRESVSTQAVPAPDRQKHSPDVGRPEVPRGYGRDQVTGSPRGNDQGGRLQRDQGVISDNWSLEFTIAR